MPSVPGREEVGDLIRVGNEVLQTVTMLHRRVLGRLAVTAEEVERTLGMEPLTIEEPGEPA